jgi:uncharacterized Zn finger protein (UPF0148 family)
MSEIWSSNALTKCPDCGCDVMSGIEHEGALYCSVCGYRRTVVIPSDATRKKQRHGHGPKPGKGLPPSYGGM